MHVMVRLMLNDSMFGLLSCVIVVLLNLMKNLVIVSVEDEGWMAALVVPLLMEDCGGTVVGGFVVVVGEIVVVVGGFAMVGV